MLPQKTPIWDWPVRLSHWGFALLVPAMWWTSENGEMGWHMRLGLVLLALVLFRILWGLVGSETARFAGFLRSPLAGLQDLIGRHKRSPSAIGHSPSGGWSVAALLLVMLAQASMGLFAGDPYDGATGPLNSLVGVMTTDWLTDWHKTGFWVLVALIALHLLAVFGYQFLGKRNLIGPMITGSRKFDRPVAGNSGGSTFRALVCLALAGGVSAAIGTGMAARWLGG